MARRRPASLLPPLAAPLLAGGAFLLLSFLFLLLVDLDVEGRFYGLYLLRGAGSKPLALKDDLLLGEEPRLLVGVDLELLHLLGRKLQGDGTERGLYVEWDEGDGSGFVTQNFPGGEALVTNFSRFLDSDGKEVQGVFVGGGLPESVRDREKGGRSDTGMAYFDGARWHHLWCSANEGITGGPAGSPMVPPSAWRFLGSRVLYRGPRRTVVSSAHRAEVDGLPLRIERSATFLKGDRYFRLTIRITNEGSRPGGYVYVYGDEPWVGRYGTSEGNVGWTRDGVVKRVTRIDPQGNRFAGFWDAGNDLSDPPGPYSYVANFIEWLPPEAPDAFYFSNGPEFSEADAANGVPLRGNARFVGLQWGPREIGPGESREIRLAIGMALSDRGGGRPVKPPVPEFPLPAGAPGGAN